MTTNKDLFINSIKLVEVDERTNIPTVICYKNNKALIGYEAFSSEDISEYLIENFKLELGNQDISVALKKQFTTDKLISKSAHTLTNDFMDSVLKKAEYWIEARGYKKAAMILVAEPIAMGEKETVKASWLTNYRSHIKRILESSSKFENVDFLPEPFAVYQYYRYGLNHPLIAQKKKHIALVLDFGGGTFDVSVIESTAVGDISAGGRNAKPLAAASRPVGGFYINQEISEMLLFEAASKDANKGEYRKALRKFYELTSSDAEDNLSSLRDDYKQFIRQFKKIVRDVEKAKVLICNQIQNWDIEAELRPPIPSFHLNIPTNALKEKSEYASIKLDAYKLRELFIGKIWKNNIKPVILEVLARAEKELKGQPVSIVLMSGGSSNIRWLASLVKSDLQHNLPDAEVLELQENFQEIVATGLAIECARRTYSKGVGDFKSITYNRLSLTLNPDDRGIEVKRFKPRTPELPTDNLEEGVLLPSSSLLGKLIDQPIRWKVTLQHPPRQKLDYYFMRSSFNHEDTENIFNIDHTVYTKNNKFGSSIQVELRVQEDGTTTPKFIYYEGDASTPTNEVTGKPFYMDMTFGSHEAVGEAYLGFDFGSSNSSVSYVEQSAITVYQDRSKDKNWLELNELVEKLPYPVSAPLAKYIASGNGVNQEMLALESVEAFIGFASYLSYAELCAVNGSNQTKFFRGFTQRSAGPLWALLKDTQKNLAGKSDFTFGFKKLLDNTFFDEIDHVISEIADFKHGKSTSGLNYFNLLKTLGNITNQVMSGKVFGSFESVQRQMFGKKGFMGQFREAKGKNPPFIHQYIYEGLESFSEEQVFLIDIEKGEALCISPLMFFIQGQITSRVEYMHLYTYDIGKSMGGAITEFTYKATEISTPLNISQTNDYSAIYDQLIKMKNSDQESKMLEGIILKSLSHES